MKYDSVILKCKELHSSQLQKYDGIHIFGFRLPINLEHRTHFFVLLTKNLKFIVYSVPSLNKWRTTMLFDFFVIMLKFYYILAFAVLILTLWNFFCFFILNFSRTFCAFGFSSFLFNVAWIKLVVFIVIQRIANIHFFLFSSSHLEPKSKIYNKNEPNSNKNSNFICFYDDFNKNYRNNKFSPK